MQLFHRQNKDNLIIVKHERERLIIENRTDLTMAEVMIYVEAVLSQGRISDDGKQYCYVSVFEKYITVSSFKNAKSDRLVITQYPEIGK
jgi:hypothetical protein